MVSTGEKRAHLASTAAGVVLAGLWLGLPAAAQPTASTLVINEIDYDQPATDTAEFVELKNVSGAAIADLSIYSLELVNGNGGGAALYDTIALPAATLAAGGYFVVCSDATTTANCDLEVSATNLLQNGAPDAVGLRSGTALVDAVSYEGDTGAPYTEGSGVGLVDDPANADMGISRCPDGVDTDRNNIDFSYVGITPGAANACAPPPLPLVCGDPATLIHAVQGAGASSPMQGMVLELEAVVVGDFQNNASMDDGELNGFYLQEEDADADADALTSEGLFVFAPGAPDVAVGDAVRVRGTVQEFATAGGASLMTELTSVTDVVSCSSGNPAPSASAVSLPVSSSSDLERYEGMLVTFPQALTISEYFNFDRFNEVVLTAGRQFQPTAIEEPGSPEAAALAQANALGRITLDDGRNVSNPDPAIHPDGSTFDLTHPFRGGDTLLNLVGVIDESFGLYRVQPTGGASYTAVNARPAQPDAVGGQLKIASLNVLNYFLTLDVAGPICGPGQNQDCRGADDANELTRQRDKILAALDGLGADVVGLIEMENTPGVEPAADLVDGLNDIAGPGTWDLIDTGVIGTDAIRVGLIYRTAAVSPVGGFAILDSTVDPDFDDTRNRPALAQTFQDSAGGGVLTVAINHLKSKGSACGPGDDDPEQGSCNGTRTAAAEALADWLAGDPTGSGNGAVLILGDLNSYAMEDPISALVAGGYTDLIRQSEGEHAYSYVFDGQLGYLDHALANAALAGSVTGVTEWHINADEPDILDYDTSFKQPAQQALYESNAFRSSDHDPVIVGLDLCDQTPPTLEVSVSPETLWPPNHRYGEVVATVQAADDSGASPVVSLISVVSNEPDNGLGDGDRPDDVVVVDDTTFELRAERSGAGAGRIYTLTYQATDSCGNHTTVSATVTVPRDQREQRGPRREGLRARGGLAVSPR